MPSSTPSEPITDEKHPPSSPSSVADHNTISSRQRILPPPPPEDGGKIDARGYPILGGTMPDEAAQQRTDRPCQASRASASSAAGGSDATSTATNNIMHSATIRRRSQTIAGDGRGGNLQHPPGYIQNPIMSEIKPVEPRFRKEQEDQAATGLPLPVTTPTKRSWNANGFIGEDMTESLLKKKEQTEQYIKECLSKTF
ncbi:MAG: hypothetical protein Q9220_001961 [cf. Caloplaca sp. 1 TL-2023]